MSTNDKKLIETLSIAWLYCKSDGLQPSSANAYRYLNDAMTECKTRFSNKKTGLKLAKGFIRLAQCNVDPTQASESAVFSAAHTALSQ